MLKILAIGAAFIVIALLALVAYASTRPDTFRIARTMTIAAPPADLFARINDLHAFNAWNPYLRKDPATRNTYSGPSIGPAASYAWESDKVGIGSMTIRDSVPAERVTMDLVFLKPFQAQNLATFTLQPNGAATDVTWAMEGKMPLMSKIMDVVIGLDGMIGRDFEDGLKNLKALAET